MRNLAVMPLLLALHGAAAGAEIAGCDEARWREWRAIIEEAAGWPEEQADAASVMARNRELCAAHAAGKITEEEGAELYQEALDAWTQRVRDRRRRREEWSGSTESG